MRRWLIFGSLGVLIIAGLVTWWIRRPNEVHYLTATVSRGEVVRTVVATGSVNPVVTVQVGSYVSGIIKALYCDYNTRVKAGQLCAKIDPKPFQVAVDQAKGNLEIAVAQLAKDKANLKYARTNYKRDQRLLKSGIVSQDTLDSDQNVYQQAEAQIQLDKASIIQRKAALEAAQVNLSYTNIVSPVDGTVVSRNVDVGQTVAASFQTPTLFLIAQDLTKMQVDTNVSESDIGAVKVGQRAYFTVEAYPGKRFDGKVTEVREAPITVQNVVTYDAVISVNNPSHLLLPGMTANAHIVTAERQNVLRIPAQALLFNPSGQSLNKQTTHTASKEQGVWILRSGHPIHVPVKTGLSDGTYVEVTSSTLKAGDSIIVGEAPAGERQNARRSRSPFGFH